METTLEDTPALNKELRDIFQAASLKLIETGAPAPAVFEAMFVVGLAGLVEVEGKLSAAQRLAQVAARLAQQVEAETANRTVN